MGISKGRFSDLDGNGLGIIVCACAETVQVYKKEHVVVSNANEWGEFDIKGHKQHEEGIARSPSSP